MSEFYPTITKPLRGARAFKEVSETASQPQAAILLMLARQLRGDDESLVARARSDWSSPRNWRASISGMAACGGDAVSLTSLNARAPRSGLVMVG